MVHAQYLVVGSSHAALEAVSAIRMHDPEGSLALVTRDSRLPYSPTVLPYVVSGRSAPDNVFLRATDYFVGQRVAYMADRALTRLHPERNAATLSDGAEIAYDKLLLATGASPAIPPIPGIEQVPYHVLRTLDDALKLKAAVAASRRAIVLGGGLVGMHAAENLVKGGADVTIVEMQPQVLGSCGGRLHRTRVCRERRAHSHRTSRRQALARRRRRHGASGRWPDPRGGSAADGDRRKARHGLSCGQPRRA
jgi:phenylglyoxylate dehydrogenase epsilon subunit